MSEWTDERVAMLRRLWGLGWTASKIAVELGVTRNTVIGKAHRLHLVKRPNPIKSKDAAASDRKRRWSFAATMDQKKRSAAALERARELSDQAAARRAAEKPVAKVVPLPTPLMRVGSCAWPIGDPRAEDFSFCGAKQVVAGKPYCHEHCRVAYQPMASMQAAE